MATIPQGWKQGNSPNIYEANIKQTNISTGSVSLVAETNKSNGDYTVYTTSGINFIGGRTPLYTVSSSGARTIQNQTVYNQLQQSGEIAKLDSSIKPRAFEINQNFGTPEEKKSVANSTLYKSRANAAPLQNGTTGDGSTTEASSGLQEALQEESNKNTRKKYQDVVYPLNLDLKNQDCIKFTIVEYKAPGIKPGSSDAGSRIVTLDNSNPKFGKGKDRKILATITLPIPAGINDRNSADWQGNPLDEIGKAFTDLSLSAILGGGQAAVDSGKNSTDSLAPGGKTAALQKTMATKAAEAAVGTSNILSRQFGNIINPNLELLFNGPSLRSFTFNFRFTPREQQEAVAVRKIIRQFKQAMSVKRSESSLLLRSPHTFAISYLSKNTDHPYLNKFKECALTDCAVSYTPDGTYMTYEDSSMTAYELSLTFQELEPIFDDDYFEIDQNKDSSIGF